MLDESILEEEVEPQSDSSSGIAPMLWERLAWLLLVLAAAVLAYWFGLCQASGPGSNSAEAGFARDMITHHAQAVDMATLIRERSSDPEIRQLALDILLTQQAQIGQMQGWLNTWGYPLASAGPAMEWMGMPVSGLMPGMASPEQLNQLRGLESEPADILFLQLMITHHLSGVDMARAALELAHRPEVHALAHSMLDAQTLEIDLMNSLLERKGQSPVEDNALPHDTHMP